MEGSMFASKELDGYIIIIIIKMSLQKICNESALNLNIKGLTCPETQGFVPEGPVPHLQHFLTNTTTDLVIFIPPSLCAQISTSPITLHSLNALRTFSKIFTVYLGFN
jgi:hypothetical protein